MQTLSSSLLRILYPIMQTDLERHRKPEKVHEKESRTGQLQPCLICVVRGLRV